MPKSMEEKFAEAIIKGMFEAPKKKSTTVNKEAVKELAHNNKVLFDEHIKVGFTAEQSMQIITAIINKL